MTAGTRQHAKFGAAAYADLNGKLPQPYPRPMGANTQKYVSEVVESGLTVDMTGRFERAFAQMMGVKHCISAPGCTNAIAVLGAALGLSPGDEIIFSPIADYGTVMGFIQAGIIPIFADTDGTPGNPNVSARTIAPHINSRTRGIVCVHKTGLICDMDPIVELGRRHGIPVYEDVCQAAFGRYKGRYAGTLADAAMFSFDSEKSIGSDVGGCLITNDDRLAEAARFMGHARAGEMRTGFGRVHTAQGLAMRMPSCTAAVTLAQIEEAPQRIAARDRAARRITAGLAQIPGIIPLHIPDYIDVYSCWMMGFSIDPAAFRCDADAFGVQVHEAGLSGASTARYYLMPAALPFLTEKATRRQFPYSAEQTTHTHRYDASTTPNAARFLDTFIRWVSFCEKYTDEHSDMAIEIVRRVADKNRA